MAVAILHKQDSVCVCVFYVIELRNECTFVR